MRKLIVHNPCNEHTKNYRDYNLFWDDLTEVLKTKYSVSENRYFQNAHFEKMGVKLNKGTLYLNECEYVIEDADSHDFWILSINEQLSCGILNEQFNPHLKKVLYSQYIPDQIVHHCGENSYKYIPWIFFPQNVVDLEFYYQKRKEKEELIPKIFFKGGTEYRPIINYIDENILSETKKITQKNYFENLIDYDMCLSVGGVANGDLCYRDVECMALGIPLIRFEFVTTLNPGLIPNYHYISIPLPKDLPRFNDVPKDRLGNENHAKLIEERFYEVINNRNYLKFISENARKYYEDYLSRYNRIHHTLNLLGLE